MDLDNYTMEKELLKKGATPKSGCNPPDHTDDEIDIGVRKSA